MAEKDQHINHYTAADIQRYLNKQMTSAEMHAFEKASLEDPFLSEALEGYIDSPVSSIPSDINELKERLIEKSKPERKVVFYKKIWWSAAASVLLLLGTAVTWFWLRPSTGHDIAQQKTKQEHAVIEQQEAPAATPGLQDSVSIESSKSDAEKPGIVTPQSSPVTPEAKKTPGHIDTNKALKKAESRYDVDVDEIASFKLKDSLSPETERQLNNAEVAAVTREHAKDFSDNGRKVVAARNAAPSIPAYLFKGTITDEQNKPLPFVNINVRGTGLYAYTDANGNFSFMSGDTQMVVHVKSVGFKPENFVVNTNIASNKISLKNHETDLSEVVVVGHGTKRKQSKAVDKQEDNDEMEAEPADGWGNYDIYLLNNERVTEQGLKALSGSVELSFVVNQYGHLTDFNILKSTCPACEKEAIRLIKEGPKWKLIKGKAPAKVEVSLHF